MRDLDAVFPTLAASSFRARFRLGEKERAYLEDRGVVLVLAHAADFVAQRLAPAAPQNDGKQTPMRGHPAFIAQHATATCCRSCLARWHGISQGRPLSDAERRHVVAAIERWLIAGLGPRPVATDGAPPTAPPPTTLATQASSSVWQTKEPHR